MPDIFSSFPRALAAFAFVLFVGVAGAQPPGSTGVDSVSMPAFPGFESPDPEPAASPEPPDAVGPPLPPDMRQPPEEGAGVQAPQPPAPPPVAADSADASPDPGGESAGTGGVSADPDAAEPPERTDERSVPVGGESSLTLAERAASLLGAVLDPDASSSGGLTAVPAGAFNQSLGQALFAAPVAGSIPYVISAEVYHDITLVFPQNWRIVDVYVGDPDRWAVVSSGHLVLLKPGEAGIRSNLTVVLDNGDILQMDLEEVTGVDGRERTGRVYIGPEQWLVDRIFGMLPPVVRARVARSPATVAELLADPLTVVGLYGGTGAVPNPLARRASQSRRLASALPRVVPTPTLGDLDGVVPDPVVLDEPDLVPVVDTDLGAPPEVPGAADFPPHGPPAEEDPGSDAAARFDLPDTGRWISAPELADLEARLRGVSNRADQARRNAGDRVAAAQMGVESELAALREDYPLRTQFSYVFDPPVPPYTEPFWHFGSWHDGERTFWRLLGRQPEFVDQSNGELVGHELIGPYLYRLERVVEDGSVSVLHPDTSQRRVLYFRRRRELEGP